MLVMTVALMINRLLSQELHQDTILEKLITEVSKLRSESHVIASLTLKAPPIICSSRRLQIFPLFQTRHDIS